MMFRSFVPALALVTAALLASPAAVFAQTAPAQTAPSQTTVEDQAQAETGQPPQRIRQITLTGSDTCPKATADEIVVCSRLDPSEQYRVPKELRAPLEVPAQNQSWVNRAAVADQVGRVAGGLPNTCSPVGSGGQTGCSIMQGKAWAAEKRQQKIEAGRAAPLTDPDDDGK